MKENDALKFFENEVTILDCLIENDKDIIVNCDTEDDEFDYDKELAELSLKDYYERKELFETAISALKEVQQYREIGTVEECREAVEKQKPSIPIKTKDGNLACKCGLVIQLKNVRKSLYYCTNCGRNIDWDSEPENLEGMKDE